jgi:outer membrane protein assembly factor BamB
VSDVQSLNKSGNALFVTNNRRQAAAISAKNGKVLWVTDLVSDVNAYLKSDGEEKKIAEANKIASKERELIEAKKSTLEEDQPKNTGLFSRLKEKLTLTKDNDQKVHTSNRKPVLSYEYDINKQKPLGVMKALIMNDNLVLYTDKGLVYYISAEDGSLISQKRIKPKYSYITFGESIIFGHNDKLFYEK